MGSSESGSLSEPEVGLARRCGKILRLTEDGLGGSSTTIQSGNVRGEQVGEQDGEQGGGVRGGENSENSKTSAANGEKPNSSGELGTGTVAREETGVAEAKKNRSQKLLNKSSGPASTVRRTQSQYGRSRVATSIKVLPLYLPQQR